jgi:hypothetical protein
MDHNTQKKLKDKLDFVFLSFFLCAGRRCSHLYFGKPIIPYMPLKCLEKVDPESCDDSSFQAR